MKTLHKADILAEQVRRREYEPSRYYIPNGKLEEWYNLKTFIRVFCGGNRTSKTSGAVNAVCHLCYGLGNEYLQKPQWKLPIPNRGRILSTHTAARNTYEEEIRKWFPRGRYNAIKVGRTFDSLYTTDTGCKFDILTYDQAESEAESVTLDWALFDEPPTRELFIATVSRMFVPHKILMVVMTPLYCEPWVYDDFVAKKRPNSAIVYADIEDNCIEHGVRGHFSHQVIQEILEQYDPETLEARAHGKFMHLAGMVYKGFSRKIHVLREPFKPRPGVPVYMSIDPHAGRPFAITWAFLNDNQQLVIYDEWPEADYHTMTSSSLALPDIIAIIKEKEGGMPISTRIIDRHFANNRDASTGLTLKEQLYKQSGWGFRDSYNVENEVDTGVLKVKEWLRHTDKVPPRLLFSPNCRNNIRGMEAWAYDTHTGKYKEQYKDFPDTVRHIVMANPRVSVDIPHPVPKAFYRI